MTREEARKILQKLATNSLCVEDYSNDKIKISSRMGAQALRPVSRETVEKVWRGVWKHYLPPLGAGNIQCRCTKCGRTPDVETPFCAWCGAAQTDEAVEMVMERLEALKDEAKD
jgi:hypothetical protein